MYWGENEVKGEQALAKSAEAKLELARIHQDSINLEAEQDRQKDIALARMAHRHWTARIVVVPGAWMLEGP